jgi:anti-anti-sigma factor
MAGLADGDSAAFEVAADRAGTATVTVRGDLDVANIDALADAVDPVIARGVERLVVDVGQLRFADSSAIALWVRWATTVKHVELRDPSPLLRKVINSMGLGAKLQVQP